MGLELRDDKTRITHTLEGGKDYQTGFDFLGFNIRQYRTPRRRINKTQRPYKTHIKPSFEKVKGIVKRLGDVIRQNRSVSQLALIEKLNPIIRGWANYNRVGVAKEIFSYLDHILYLQLKRWAERRHPKKGKEWVKNRYWHTVGQRNWVFGVQQGGIVTVELATFTAVPMIRHTKVVGEKRFKYNTCLRFVVSLSCLLALRSSTAVPELSDLALVEQLALEYAPSATLNYDRARDQMFGIIDNQAGIVIDIYASYPIRLTGSVDPSQEADGLGLNTEHTWPQSKGADKVKGDIARAMFYFYTIYRDQADRVDPNYFDM